MGADIHIFVEEIVNTEAVNLDRYYFGRDEELIRVGSYEGRSSILFDILQKDVPQRGFPKTYSKVFREEWESYKHCRYGVNHISFHTLYNYWAKEQKKTFKKLNSVDEFNKSIALFPLVNGIYKSIVDLDSIYWSYKTDRWKDLSIIYFFDR